MTKNFFIVILLLVSFSVFSQKIIEGTVKDENGNPLEMANVIAINQTDQSMEGYAITNDKGRYKITVKNDGDIQLKVSYLGYDSQTKVLVLSDKKTTKDFVLKESKNDLDAVEITYEMPVTVKGDTIVYNADSFTTGKEKKLGDVLEKLPGVEVNTDGEVEVEGKKVSKVMLDGKDFFDGDSKLATKNIPADAIKKVEVLKNYNEVSQMRGLGDDSDNVALNIKLKEGKKNFWFGEVTGGAGEGGKKARYLAHPKLFYYSPKKSINIITDMNNIGEIPFTFRDYFSFTGGFKNMMRGGGINISSNSLGLSLIKDNKAKEIENKFGAINFSQEASKSLNVSGFAIYSGSKTEMETATLRTNTFTDASGNLVETTEKTSDNTLQNNDLGLLKLSASYKPNVNFQLDYDVLFKKSALSEQNNLISDSDITGLNDIKSKKEEEPFSVNQNTNIYYTLNAKNIFSFACQFLYEKNKPLYNAINSDQRFTLLPTVDEGTDYNLNQSKNLTTKKADLLVDYYYILNNKSNLNFSFGTVFNNQNLQSDIYQILDNGNRLNFNDAILNNDVIFNFSDVFLGLHYKLQAGKFTITPGLSFHNYISKNKQLSQETKFTLNKILPDLNVKFAIKSSESIRFKYEMTTNFTDINNLAEGVLLNSYNSLSIGNRNLKNALYHSYNLNYFSFNMFSYLNMRANINYSKKFDVIKNTSQLIGIDRINSVTNIDNPEDNLSFNAGISKRIKKIKASLSGSRSIANAYRLSTLPNGEIVKTKTKFTTQSYTTRVQSNFSNWPNFEVGFSSSLSQFDQSKSVTNKPFANIEIAFLKDFTFIADYTYNSYHNKTNNIKNTYDFLNTDLYYKKESSKWEFKASAINLLNTTSINQDNFSVFTQSSSQYFVQPRMFMFTVKYEL
ncbi:MAG TPA: TonB-dependent receptor [Flavobacteriia bacterium]|nr:TonB-dependent receptor [Flavobacteriia bacterium]